MQVKMNQTAKKKFRFKLSASSLSSPTPSENRKLPPDLYYKFYFIGSFLVIDNMAGQIDITVEFTQVHVTIHHRRQAI